jgi:hypothetical protein
MLRLRVTESTSLAVGAAYGTSKAGIGIAGLGQFKPELIMKVRHIPRTRLPISSHNASGGSPLSLLSCQELLPCTVLWSPY